MGRVPGFAVYFCSSWDQVQEAVEKGAETSERTRKVSTLDGTTLVQLVITRPPSQGHIGEAGKVSRKQDNEFA